MCNKWDKRKNSAFTVRCTNMNIKSSGLSYSRCMYLDELLDNLHFHALGDLFLFLCNYIITSIITTYFEKL